MNINSLRLMTSQIFKLHFKERVKITYKIKCYAKGKNLRVKLGCQMLAFSTLAHAQVSALL